MIKENGFKIRRFNSIFDSNFYVPTWLGHIPEGWSSVPLDVSASVFGDEHLSGVLSREN